MLHPDSVDYTGVCTDNNLFVWSRLPFGVRNGPPHFQRTMNLAIREAGLGKIVQCFIDDLATGGGNHKTCAANTGKMFAMLKRRRLKVGADKIFTGLN